MTVAADDAAGSGIADREGASPDDQDGDGVLRRFVRLAGPFLIGRAGVRPVLLGLLLIALSLLQVGIQVRMNIWNRDFFNALEARDRGAFLLQIAVFLGLAGTSMATWVVHLYLKQLLQLRWREWLTSRLMDGWLADGRQYQLGFVSDGADNPDQRIAEDARLATELAIEFAVGIIASIAMLIAFVGILWSISGSLSVGIGDQRFEIYGYMVWCALLYALAGSYLTWRLGRPMVDINVRRNAREADFRFGLVRVREAGESIALIRGEPDEVRGLRHQFSRVAAVWVEFFRAQRTLMWLTSAYGNIATILPTLVASPRYFSGAITLGGLMQIGAAFAQVQLSLNWFVDTFPKLAEWRASVDRVVELDDAVKDVAALRNDPDQPTIEVVDGDGSELLMDRVAVRLSDGMTLIGEANARISRGERVLITGESGTGKSTLFRAMAGLWPWGGGRIVMPPADQRMFMPQRPYLPLGTLSAALCYPHAAGRFNDADLAGVLDAVGLERLADRLAEEARWDQALSLGEQQRLGFARLLLQKPAWVFMDEATSALDEANQDAMMRLFLETVPEAALISIGHRPGLEAFHTRTLALIRGEDGARLTVKRRPRPQRARQGLIRRAVARLPIARPRSRV
jgi:putative ATP-binding cassette transporter